MQHFVLCAHGVAVEVHRDQTMLLMFLTASATSALSMGVMKAASTYSREACTAGGDKYLTSRAISYFSSAVGGFLIGAGMAISGTCPGTIWAQLGSGQLKTLITFAGGVVGAAALALINHRIKAWLEWGAPSARTLDKILGVSQLAAGAMIAVAFVVVVIIVSLVPGWYRPLEGLGWSFDSRYWHPIIGGLLVGSMQIPLSLGVKKNLGASTSFSVLAAHLLRPVIVNDYTRPLLGGSSWWNVLFVVFCTAGAALAALSGNTWYTWEQMASISEAEAFFGGILILFGARIASGCTSGHGMTGVGHGSILSFISVAGIFAGGMSVAFPFYMR